MGPRFLNCSELRPNCPPLRTPSEYEDYVYAVLIIIAQKIHFKWRLKPSKHLGLVPQKNISFVHRTFSY